MWKPRGVDSRVSRRLGVSRRCRDGGERPNAHRDRPRERSHQPGWDQDQPQVIEDVLLSVDGIAEAAAFGVPERWASCGSGPRSCRRDRWTWSRSTRCAASVCAPTRRPTPQLTELPRNENGKVLRAIASARERVARVTPFLTALRRTPATRGSFAFDRRRALVAHRFRGKPTGKRGLLPLRQRDAEVDPLEGFCVASARRRPPASAWRTRRRVPSSWANIRRSPRQAAPRNRPARRGPEARRSCDRARPAHPPACLVLEPPSMIRNASASRDRLASDRSPGARAPNRGNAQRVQQIATIVGDGRGFASPGSGRTEPRIGPAVRRRVEQVARTSASTAFDPSASAVRGCARRARAPRPSPIRDEGHEFAAQLPRVGVVVRRGLPAQRAGAATEARRIRPQIVRHRRLRQHQVRCRRCPVRRRRPADSIARHRAPTARDLREQERRRR